MIRSGRWRHIALLVALACARSASAAPIVAGRAGATFGYDPAVFVPSYRNEGFEQSADAGRARVTVRATEGWSRAPFSLPAEVPPSSAAAALAREAAARASTRAEAVAAVLHAVAGRIRYADAPGLPEDPIAVLERGEASCVGLANLAVEALLGIGIRARVARGALANPGTGTIVPHRWVEVWYPDAGWVFSDPTESANYVSAMHLLLTPPGDPDPGYEPARVRDARLELVAHDDELLAVDLRPGRSSPIGERRLLAAQFSGSVRGRVVPPRAGTVRLVGADRTWETSPRPSGGFAFAGLPPGLYRLEGSFAEGTTSLSVSVASSELVEIEVQAP